MGVSGEGEEQGLLEEGEEVVLMGDDPETNELKD